jgi:hypothetical protein
MNLAIKQNYVRTISRSIKLRQVTAYGVGKSMDLEFQPKDQPPVIPN